MHASIHVQGRVTKLVACALYPICTKMSKFDDALTIHAELRYLKYDRE